MKSLWFLVASLLDGGWHLSKFDKNTMQGTFPYGVLFEEDKVAYHFRFQWVQELMFRTGKLLNVGVRGQSIVYSNKVWRAWKLKHNIFYFFHYKYDRPYGVGIGVDLPYRYTFKQKNPKKETYA